MSPFSQSRPLIFFSMLLVCLGVFLQRCTLENEMTTEVPGIPKVDQRPAIQPAFETVNVEPTHFQLDASEGGEHTFPSGTRVSVPADILVDAAGNPVSGEVDFSLREFHDAADLLLSGITMKYDSGGIAYDFQTAGMMELEASQNGQPVFIQPGGKVEVSLATFTPEDNYNLYYLDENTGEWTYTDDPQLSPNEAKEAALEALNTVMPDKPFQPKQLDPEEFTYDFAVDYSEMTELNAFKDIHWEYAGTKSDEDPNANDWIFDITWTQVDLKEISGTTGKYSLILGDDRGKSFTTTVTPALEGRNFAIAMEQFQQDLKAYQDKENDVKAESDRLTLQANMIRTFSISEFGIYNCDRLFGREEVLQFAAHFEFEKGVELDPQSLTVYLVTGDNRSVIPYYPGTGMYAQSQFKIDPGQKNKLVAVIPGNQIAVFSEKDFANTNLREAMNNGQYTFQMKTLPQKIESPNELRTALEII